MTELAHMQAPAVLAAQVALARHLEEHPPCAEVRRQRDLCPVAQELHTAVVVAAQDAYRELHPEAFLAAGGPVPPGQLLMLGDGGPETIIRG